ncbi:efflux RND transporter permease subunit [Roseomonas rosulenta]|uniref:efflux RND transporter permease subunit n=1 Tax=Roseomonas rosulenta TaxID=2748667 RepID=UPI0018DFA8DB|nr:multidrug efflux RND transporter permease subunit [Roseomonas rosulenta]
MNAIPRFFVDQPIFAVVLSALMLVAGGLALLRLPLSEYPAVTPPTVQVVAQFPGASPRELAETVAAPIEQEVNGVEGMLYMTSQSVDGQVTLAVTFAQGTDADLAQIRVQNRVQRALPRLPEEAQRQGVVARKVSPDMLMVVHLVSPNGRYDALHLANFATLQVRDRLQRLPGVGEVNVWGAGDYAMRIWLDPERMAARGLTAAEVLRAVRSQNLQVAAGAVGRQPGAGMAPQVAIDLRGRLAEPEEYATIVIRAGEDGRIVRLGDVARVELGAEGYALRSLLDGEPAAALQVVQAPGANALDVAARVRFAMTDIAAEFPEGITHRIAYDPTIFVRASIAAVLTTLLEAVGLVVLVVVLFLQSWRSSLIPLVAVPVSLVGTLAVMLLLGYTLNTLSLFGLVLAIGIVVDDAIVVVENVERHMAAGLAPKAAARQAMEEVTGPIVAITSVLAAVFVPAAFLSGLQGEFYRQFAVTIAVSTVLSAINSLTLSPALAGVMLRPHGTPQRGPLGAFFRLFNRGFDATAVAYGGFVRRAARAVAVALVLYAGLLGLGWAGLQRVPTGFVPQQDKYYLVGIAILPAGTSIERSEAMAREMSRIMLEEPGVESVVAFPGLSIDGFVTLPNAAVVFTMLDPFEQRRTADLSANAIAQRLQGRLFGIQEGLALVFPPPPVPGIGAVGGFKLQVQNRAGLGLEALARETGRLVEAASRRPELAGVMSSFHVSAPQLRVELDRDRALAMGVSPADVAQALQLALGSLYVNDFQRDGRTYRVIAQADAAFRLREEDLARLRVRSATGAMVPIASLVTLHTSTGPDRVVRHNGYPSAEVSGAPAPGFGSSQAQAAMEALAREVLPAGFAVEWTELALQERLAGNAAIYVFPVAVLLAFLLLAAQYGSWSLPLAVLPAAPLAVVSALAGVLATGGDSNVFTQIAWLVLVGLAAKNAILVVEFAREREMAGLDPLAAVIEAGRLRLRPILMTSIAFVAGAVPLAVATGAGAEMRQAMGIAVAAGMAGVTLLGLLFTPVFYLLVRRMAARRTDAAIAAHAVAAE